MTDVKPELLECFAEGTEIACYRSPEEFQARLARLLAAPRERETLARAGHARFRAAHTWNHRVEQVLPALGIF